jgi:hypothetical protein
MSEAEDEDEDVYDIVVVCDDDASWCSQSLRGFDEQTTHILVKRARWGELTTEQQVEWLLSAPDRPHSPIGMPKPYRHAPVRDVSNLPDFDEESDVNRKYDEEHRAR